MFPCLPIMHPAQGKILKGSALHSQESVIDLCDETCEASHWVVWVILCMALKDKLWKRKTKSGFPAKGQRDWSVYTNKELKEDDCIMQELAESLIQQPMRTLLWERITSAWYDLHHQQGKESTEAFKIEWQQSCQRSTFQPLTDRVFHWKGQ